MSLLIGYFFLALGVSFICSLLEAVILSVTHSHIATLVKINPKKGKMIQVLIRNRGPDHGAPKWNTPIITVAWFKS